MNTPMKSGRNWYTVYTMPKAEKKVNDSLQRRNLDTFLPLYQKVVQRSDRKKKLWTPLFPGYVFINLNTMEMDKVYGVPGVLRFISTQGKKDVIPDREIDVIRLLLKGKPEITAARLSIGQQVKVIHGPFVGLTGILMNYKGGNKLIVRLNTLNQNVAVEISSDHVRPVEMSRSGETFCPTS